MSEDKKTAEDNSASKPADVQDEVVSLAPKRAEIYERYEKLSASLAVKDESASDAENLKKSESDQDASVKAPDSDASSVKDAPAAKLSDEQENIKKALHEEREKRKEANRRLKDLQAKYDSQTQELQAKLEQVSKPADSFEPGSSEDVLRKENEALRRERAAQLEKDKQATIKANQESLQSRISKVHKELKDDGYPGFDLALAKTDAAIVKRIQEGDILPEDAGKSEVWKSVFIEDVFPAVAAEFEQVKKEKTSHDKIQAKQNAKMTSSPGTNPAKEQHKEDKDESMDDFNKKYLASRRANNPNIRHS